LALIQDVKNTTIIELWLKADLHQAEDLKLVCKQYLIEHFIELGRTNPSFLKNLSKETLFGIAVTTIEATRPKKETPI